MRKSLIKWRNINHTWLRLYVHLNKNLSSGVEKIIHLSPYKKRGRKGVESGMSSIECKKRELKKNSPDSCWDWPVCEITEEDIKNLLSIALEIAVNVFFTNFTYTFGEDYHVQISGGKCTLLKAIIWVVFPPLP